MIRAVIDTNGLLTSIPKESENRWLYDAFMVKKFVWVFSNEILSEYAEMVGFYYSERTMELVTSILLAATNAERFEPTYRLQLVETDGDDNKFVDCTACAGADYLVTDDRHMLSLRKRPNLFPPLPIVRFREFKTLLNV